MSICPRHTRRTDKRSIAIEPPVETLIEQGKAAFAQGDYTTAIHAWHQALSAPSLEDVLSSRLCKALAEAFFRRALGRVDTSIDDLLESVRLAPDEPRYQYHLALAYHRCNAWQSAIPLYRHLLERTPPYTRAAFPLSIALLETGGQPQADIVWQFLSPEERECLLGASVLLRRRGGRDSRYISSQEAHPFWTGLAAIQLRSPKAETYLAAALKDPSVPRQATGITRYYLGVLAWEGGRHAEALKHWQAAVEAGIRTPWLSGNLAWAYAQSAIALLNADGLSSSHNSGKNGSALLSEALKLAEQGLHYAPNNLMLRLVANHAHQHLGYRAARGGDWETAWKHLWAVYQAGQRGHALMINLALTAEALRQYAQAGSLWRQLVRSRSRKATSDGFMSNEHVARVWQRAAQCLSHAGSYKEAARAYQNALRYAPQDVTLQLEWIAALVQSGRYESAYSVVSNLLTQDPEHKEALAWKAYLLERSGHLYAALDVWHRVLKIDPDHPAARQHIAHLSRQVGDDHLKHGDLRRALIVYREGLEIAPKDVRLRTSLIRFYGLLGDLEKVREETERILSERPDDLEVYYWLITTWAGLGKDDIVQEYLCRAEALQPPPPVSFYITLGVECARSGCIQWANQFSEIARQHPSIDAQGLLDLAQVFFATAESQRAVECLEQAVALAPDMAEAHLLLGVYFFQAQAKQKAKEHLLQAERLAYQERNVAIAAQARRVLSTLSHLEEMI
ncbi:MAG: tetratricopeptide repeat protein [Anaerolineae bacterium]